MTSKWFFQQQFTDYDLVKVSAAACSLSYPRIGCCNENRIITLYCLNPYFYSNSNWGTVPTPDTAYYQPYDNIADLQFWSGSTSNPTKYSPLSDYIKKGATSEHQAYYKSIDYQGGWFSKRVLQAWDVVQGTLHSRPLPIALARYNPALDDGKGNELWVTTIYSPHYDKPQKTADLLFTGYPLWLCFWGYYDYLVQKKGESFMPLHFFVVKSPYIKPQQTEHTKDYYAFIDADIINGKNQYDSPITYNESKLWYPTTAWQIETINAFCECGPYVPKLANQSAGTWELASFYSFHFKWGGPHISDKPVANPKSKQKYPVPDSMPRSITSC